MKITVLGSGTSSGIPLISCECPVCQSQEPKNKRLRVSILIEDQGTNVIIDTGPDFRTQALRVGLKHLDGVFYTHDHADHLHGIDDLRPLSFKKPVDAFCSEEVLKSIQEKFPYIFKKSPHFVPQINFHVAEKEFQINQLHFTIIKVQHGEGNVAGIRVNDFAYITDCSFISKEEQKKLFGLKYFILGAIRPHKPHPKHFTFDQGIDLLNKIGKPEKTYFTHLEHQVDHYKELAKLPEYAQLAYDGLVLEL